MAMAIGLLTSCGPVKISQCNQLITIINRTSDDLSSIQPSSQPNPQQAEQMAAQLAQFSDNLAKHIQEIQAIEVDRSLQPLKDQLVASYQTALKNSKDLTVAVKAQNQPAAQAALKRLTSASDTEAKTLKEITNYCQAPEAR
jgi:transcriptional regulator of heat shock response